MKTGVPRQPHAPLLSAYMVPVTPITLAKRFYDGQHSPRGRQQTSVDPLP